jgi:enterobacterial common antigen flippase
LPTLSKAATESATLSRTAVWTAVATVVKLGAALLVVKLLAVSFGPDGVGRAGNIMTFVTVLGVLSGAGISNGITKYVAEFKAEGDDLRLRHLLGTSGSIVFGVSVLLAVLLWALAGPVSRLLFGGDGLAEVIRAMAFVQFGLAYTNLFQAILKGHRDARGIALSVVLGSVLGLLGYCVCFGMGGYVGALVGLAMVPALAVLPSWIILSRTDPLALRRLRPLWDGESARLLAKFTAMVVITSLMLPTAYVMMRNVLAEHSSWAQVGIWQGMSKISDSYLQFITAPFSVYLLPTFSRLRDKRDIARETGRVLRL